MAIRLPGFEWSKNITLPSPSDTSTAITTPTTTTTASNTEERTADNGTENITVTTEIGPHHESPSMATKSRSKGDRGSLESSPAWLGRSPKERQPRLQPQWRRESSRRGSGSGSSGGTVLLHAQFVLKGCSRDVHDDSNDTNHLRVHADVSVAAKGGGGVRSVSLWVPYWVVNTTTLSLGIRHDPFALGMAPEDIRGHVSSSSASDAMEEKEIIIAPAAVTTAPPAAAAAAAIASKENEAGEHENIRGRVVSVARLSAAGADGGDHGELQRRPAAAATEGGAAADQSGGREEKGDSKASHLQTKGEAGTLARNIRVAQRKESHRRRRSLSSKLFQQPALLGLKGLVEDEPDTSDVGSDNGGGGGGDGGGLGGGVLFGGNGEDEGRERGVQRERATLLHELPVGDDACGDDDDDIARWANLSFVSYLW